MNPYVELLGKMDIINSSPTSELAPFIEKYVFYENVNLSSGLYIKARSNGKVEMFIPCNENYLLISNERKEIKIKSFIVGISELSNALKFKPVSANNCLNGIIITFSFKGVVELLACPIKSLTNKIVYPESVLGNKSQAFVDDISRAKNRLDRENILNNFFLTILKEKKKNKKDG